VIKKTDRQNGKRKNNHKTIEKNKQGDSDIHFCNISGHVHKNKKNYIIRQ